MSAVSVVVITGLPVVKPENMRRDGCSADEISRFEANPDSNLTLQSVVGYELHLVVVKSGQTLQGAVVEALIDKLPRPLELLVMDPISRLNGAEENSEQRRDCHYQCLRADRSRGRLYLVLLIHHTGKASAKDRDVGLYAARGASGFVDAARSSIRLLQADLNDVKDFTNVPDGVIAAGDLVQAVHNKSNEGPKAKPFWLRRQGLDFERFEPRLGGVATDNRKLVDALFFWHVANNRQGFSIKRFEDKEALRARCSSLMSSARAALTP